MKHHNPDKGFIADHCPDELRELYEERIKLRDLYGSIISKILNTCPINEQQEHTQAQIEFNEWVLAINALAERLRDAEARYGMAY